MKTNLEEIIRNNHMTKEGAITIQNNSIGDEGAKAVAALLKKGSLVSSVHLYNTGISDAGVREIASSLEKNSSLTYLELSGNNITDAGAKVIASAVEKNRSLKFLELSNSHIGEEGAESIIVALEKNPVLISVNLHSNQIGLKGTTKVAAALENNKSLKEFHLCNNQIGDAGVKAIASSLEKNTALTSIYLTDNQIGNEGATQVASSLGKNSSLQKIYLSNNQIGKEGAKAIALLLQENSSLREIDLNRNQIGEEGIRAIASALDKSLLTKVNIGYNQISTPRIKEIETAATLNLNKEVIGYINQAKEYQEKKDYEQALEFYRKAAVLKPNNKSISKQIEVLEQNKQPIEAAEEKEASKEAIIKAEATDTEKAIEINKQQIKLEEQTMRTKQIHLETIKKYDPTITLSNDFFKIENIAELNNQYHIIKQISELIREGHDRLQSGKDKAILLLGNTGAGKSTLAYALSDGQLKGVMDDQTGELVVDAVKPFGDIVIGHKMSSETTIPGRCDVGNVTIWDCPGFDDTNVVREIANSFYIKRLFETTKHLKFVLVVPESDLTTTAGRGSKFAETLSRFIKGFNDISDIKSAISLIVTQVAPHKTAQHIKNSITSVLEQNESITGEQQELINTVLNSSLYIFHKPSGPGLMPKTDLFQNIRDSSAYVSARSNMANLSVSDKAKDCSAGLLDTAAGNFNKLLGVITKALTDAGKCLDADPASNPFLQNYDMVKEWVPTAINYREVNNHTSGEHFLQLSHLSALEKILVSNSQVKNIVDGISILQHAIEIFAEYADQNNTQLKHQIQDYGYVLLQQYEYIRFFSEVCGRELPDYLPLAELLGECHKKVRENLEYQVKTMSIDENHSDSDPEYYHTIIKYLDNYKDSTTCNHLKAKAYCGLASIAALEENAHQALHYYLKAIESNHELEEIYLKAGYLFFIEGEYGKAIQCYTVVNNSYKVNECFKKWLKVDPENSEIMWQRAVYLESRGIFDKAKTYYDNAFSLSQDKDVKAKALERIGNLLINASSQGQKLLDQAKERDFCDFSLVNDDFIKTLLGEEGFADSHA